MSAAPDGKSSGTKAHTATAAELKRWTDPISDGVGAALLPELISLSAEYLLVRLQFGPRLKSKRMRIVDADADGYGRELRCEEVSGLLEPRSAAGIYAALSDAPIGEVAGANGRLSWRVPLSEADQSMTVGVGFSGTALVQTYFGVDRRAYGLFVTDDGYWCLCHDGRPDGPYGRAELRPPRRDGDG